MKALRKMLERVTEARDSTINYGSRDITEFDETNLWLFNAWRFWIALPVYVGAFLGSNAFTALGWLASILKSTVSWFDSFVASLFTE